MNEHTNGLIDIIEPVAPPILESTNWLMLSAVVALLLMLAGALFYWWKYKLPCYWAVRDLHKLHEQMLAGDLSPHESALQLALNLRHHLAAKRLRADAMPQQIRQREHARWVEFMQLLDANLYQKSADVNSQSVENLYTQTRYWLQRYSRRSTLKKMVA
jgi:hypothetical protein